MIKKLKNIILSSGVMLALLVPAFVPVTVGAQADIEDNLCKGANLSFTNSGDCQPGGEAENTVNNLIEDIINILSVVVGVIAVIMIIVGGIKYILSGGDSGNVTTAKNTILFALVGLVIVALAQIIVKFVLSRVATS